jgi:hypothetical protein
VLFKLVTNGKDKENKVTLDKVWKDYMLLPDTQSLRKGTQEPLIQDKEQLIEIVEACQADNMVMFADNKQDIILI